MRELKDVEYLKISTIMDNYVEKGTSFLAQHGLSLCYCSSAGKRQNDLARSLRWIASVAASSREPQNSMSEAG